MKLWICGILFSASIGGLHVTIVIAFVCVNVGIGDQQSCVDAVVSLGCLYLKTSILDKLNIIQIKLD